MVYDALLLPKSLKLCLFAACLLVAVTQRGGGNIVLQYMKILLHIAVIYQVKDWKISGLHGIPTLHDLCDTGAVLYQLEFQNSEPKQQYSKYSEYPEIYLSMYFYLIFIYLIIWNRSEVNNEALQSLTRRW